MKRIVTITLALVRIYNLIYSGVSNTAIPRDIKDGIENVLFETSKNLKKDKILNALKLVENFLPDIMKSVHEKLATPIVDGWTPNELRKLTAAKELYPVSDFLEQPEDRWKYVRGFVNTKTLEECKEEIKLEESVKKAIAVTESEGKKTNYYSSDVLGLESKEESKEEEKKEESEEEDDEDHDSWKDKGKVVGNKEKVRAAQNALKNSVKTLIKIDGNPAFILTFYRCTNDWSFSSRI